ncbi:NLR1A protein, partial [Polypterus senegalus]
MIKEKFVTLSLSSTGRNAQGAQFGQQVQSFEGPANFLEKHREALIQRVAIVPPILDSLLSKKLIDNECYDEVLSETTNQRKMRRLYAMVSAWGNKEKLEFFNTLKEKQPYLIEDLMGK